MVLNKMAFIELDLMEKTRCTCTSNYLKKKKKKIGPVNQKYTFERGLK